MICLSNTFRITADDLYDDATAMVDEFENEEPLYVDMYDANVPSAEWIAREEERHRLEVAGVQRLSNEAFGELRFKARYRPLICAFRNCALRVALLILFCVGSAPKLLLARIAA